MFQPGIQCFQFTQYNRARQIGKRDSERDKRVNESTALRFTQTFINDVR